MTDGVFDLVVAGGGINGAGIAADASGRGLKVLLVEKADLAGATSSASSKLVHGGLRYLEHYAFRLVREALAEREVLLKVAPHLVSPQRFVLPHVAGMRPWVIVRAGLLIYDHLAQPRTLPASRAINLEQDPSGIALKPGLRRGFTYWDCWVDDARLVVLNARQAADRGALVLTRTKLVHAQRREGLWHIEVASDAGRREFAARALVDATGPWAGQFAKANGAGEAGASAPRLRLVKGSHIVVPRIPGSGAAILMQNADGRVVFALPFADRFTLIGTTDTPFEGDPAGVSIDAAEEAYLLECANRFLRTPLSAADIVWRFSGVRPLHDDGTAEPSAVSRDYVLELDGASGEPPLLTVIGGKITTYRKLAEAALARLAPVFPAMGGPWTAKEPLPGGHFGEGGIDDYRVALARGKPGIARDQIARYVRTYGSLAGAMLGDARNPVDLGADLGGGLSEREVVYLKEREWARTPEDILLRRTKIGLVLTASQRAWADDRLSQLL